jgi:hypothetical protein
VLRVGVVDINLSLDSLEYVVSGNPANISFVQPIYFDWLKIASDSLTHLFNSHLLAVLAGS